MNMIGNPEIEGLLVLSLLYEPSLTSKILCKIIFLSCLDKLFF